MSKDTPVKFDRTRERETGGNTSVKKTAEQHDGGAKGKDLGTRNGQSYAISKCLNDDKASLLDDSKPTGQKKREIGPAEAVRRAANHGRDGRVNLGTGKPSGIEVA
jgi:hypothetical protein